jgi:outer membrane beta-barrel protein
MHSLDLTRRLSAASIAATLALALRAAAASAQAAPEPAAAPPDPASAPAAPVAAASDSSAARPASPALNPRPVVGSRRVRLDKGAHNVVRSGPGDGFSIAGVFDRGTTFPVIAKSGDWFGVRLSDTETGWIHASLCTEFDDLSNLEYKPNPKLFTRTGCFVLTGYSGAYAFDRKSNSLVVGGRLGYYLFDRVVAEGGVSWTHIRRPAEIVESLFGLSLEAEDFDMLFYHLMLTYELLPGRQMVPYVSGGAGSSIMQGETEASFDFGAGTSLFVSRRTSLRWEVRDYRFRSGTNRARRTDNNIEFTLATVVLF